MDAPSASAPEDCIELGFLEEVEDRASLASCNFPSKVGGKPAWLTYNPLPTTEQLKCRSCGQRMQFLLQIYAPDYERPSSFHRTLFLFVCRDGNCCKLNNAHNFSALRCQLPRENAFYSTEAQDEKNINNIKNISDFSTVCEVCGCPGDKRCSKCKKVVYCDRPHQVWHWKSGHREQCCTDCPQKTNDLISNDCLFPEYEIVTETENYTEEKRAEKSDDEKMREFELYMKSINLEMKNGQVKETFEDLDEIKAFKTDKAFKKFVKRLEHEPEQILRYAKASEPLWATEHKPSLIPPCELCGAPRVFEFQLTPYLLSRLGVDQLGESLDWATVLVYTCSESCDVQDFGYAVEFVWKQDFCD